MNRDRAVEILFRGAHLDRDPDLWMSSPPPVRDDVTPEHLAVFLRDDELKEHPVGPLDEGRAHRPGARAVDLDRLALTRLLLGQPDGAEFGLGEDGRGDEVMVDRRSPTLEDRLREGHALRIATGVSWMRFVTSPMAVDGGGVGLAVGRRPRSHRADRS